MNDAAALGSSIFTAIFSTDSSTVMPGLWTAELLIAALLGVASHLLFFIHGEWDRYAAAIVACFLAGFSAVLAWATIQEGSMFGGLILASMLFVAYQSALGTSIMTYRLMLHRLRRFKGPLQAAVSKWSAARAAKETQQYHHVLQTLHQQFGDFVRIGPMELSINSADALRELHSPQSLCLKGPFYDLGGVGENLHRTRDPTLHDRQKPFWRQAFTNEALEQDMNGIHVLARKFIEKLFHSNSQPIDITLLVNRVGFEMMSQSTFSRQFDLDTSDQTDIAIHSLHQSQALLGPYGHVPWIYSVAKYWKGLLASNDLFTELADQMVSHRRFYTPNPPDLFTYLLQTEDNPVAAGFPLAWEARLAMVAGSANTSTTIISCCFYLATNAKVLAAVYDEVAPLISSGYFDMRKSLTVLDSVVSESMRLQPAMPSGVERMTPASGLIIAGVSIPGNIICRVPNYVLLRDERYFREPTKFIPERWTTQKDLIIDETVFHPFGQGKYGCAGFRLAMMKIRTVLAYLVMDFELELADKSSARLWEQSGKDHFLMVQGALNVKLLKRR